MNHERTTIRSLTVAVLIPSRYRTGNRHPAAIQLKISIVFEILER
jgi:hypothetical protein